MQLQIMPSLTCALCEQLIDEGRQHVDTSEAVLFGAERYAWCPACEQEVPQPWTEEYRRSWTRVMRARRALPAGTVHRLRAAWREGEQACAEGMPFSSCRLPGGPERAAWAEGYLTASERQYGLQPAYGFRQWVCARIHI